MLKFLSKALFTVMVTAVAHSGSHAQSALAGLILQGNTNAVSTLSTTFDHRYQGIRGNAYFIDAWIPGSVVIKSNKKGVPEEVKNLMLKYDVHGNQVAAVMAGDRDTLLINGSYLTSFKLAIPTYSTPVEFRTFAGAKALNPKLSDMFFAVLYDGKAKFLKGVSKTFVPANFKGAYSAGVTYDELVDDSQYFLVVDDRMVKTKLTRKALVEALPAQQEKIKAYITSQKLAMNSEADFIKVLAHLDAL